ncbi:MAG: HAMP domain-containing sensor histidine kinase [Candidatus Nanopelagicales bacterium]
MSLRRRLALIAGAVTAVAVLLVALLSGLLSARTMYEQVDAELRSSLDFNVENELATVLELSSRTQFSAQTLDILVDVYFVEGTVEPRGSVTQQVPPGDAVFNQLLGTSTEPLFETVTTINDITVRVAVIPFTDGAVIRAMRPINDLQASINTLTAGIAALAVLASFITALIASVVVGSALRPVLKLTAAAEQIAQTQKLDDSGLAEATEGRNDEIARLSASLQSLVTALARSREQQQRLVDDAAHELRTPLTSMRANLDLMEMAEATDRGITAEQRGEMLRSMNEELVELSQLVEELVALASPVPTLHEVSQESTVELAELANNVVKRFSRRSGREITLDAQPTMVQGRAALIERAIANLIGNAVKFSPEGSKINVTVRDGMVLVDDAGAGIPTEYRSQVLERFWRAPESRGLPGSGLGLSIVSDMAHSHSGSVIIDQSPLGGARVGFLLPEIKASDI